MIIIIIANVEGKKSYLHSIRLHQVLVLGILLACQDPTQTLILFPDYITHTPTSTVTSFTLSTRPLPCTGTSNTHQHTHQPLSTTTRVSTPFTAETQLPPSSPKENEWPVSPSTQHIQQNTLPQQPLAIIEFYGDTATGLEALLKTGHHIGTYAWTDISPDALAAVTHRLANLQHQYLNQLPTATLHQ